MSKFSEHCWPSNVNIWSLIWGKPLFIQRRVGLWRETIYLSIQLCFRQLSCHKPRVRTNKTERMLRTWTLSLPSRQDLIPSDRYVNISWNLSGRLLRNDWTPLVILILAGSLCSFLFFLHDYLGLSLIASSARSLLSLWVHLFVRQTPGQT